MWHLVLAALRHAVVIEGSWQQLEVVVGAGDGKEVATLGGHCG